MDKFDSKVKNDEKNTKVGCGCFIVILLFITYGSPKYN